MDKLLANQEVAEKKLAVIKALLEEDYERIYTHVDALDKDKFNKEYIIGNFAPILPAEENLAMEGKYAQAIIDYKQRTNTPLKRSKWIIEKLRDTFKRGQHQEE